MTRIWSAGLPLAAALAIPLPAQVPIKLLEPVQLQADGKTLDTVADIGHAGQLLRDHDGDGKLDLLVSSFRGSIRLFKNVGDGEVKWQEQAPLEAGGEAIRIHNW